MSKDPLLESGFTFAEFNKVLNSRKMDSSPGLDGVDYEVIKRMPIKFKLLLIDIFNEMFQKSKYPNDWLHTYVHMIPKSNRSGVRPISLNSCMS